MKVKTMTLDELEKLVNDARSPRDLFKPFGDVKKTIRAWSMVCHPDRNPGDARAEALFKKFMEMAEQMQQPPFTVKSPKRTYEFLKLLAVGDVADVHLTTSDNKDYIFKASRIKEGAAILDNERRVVADLLTAAGDAHYLNYFPTLVESFPVKSRFQKRVNVFAYKAGVYTLAEVADKHPSGLDGRHLAWI